MSSFHRAVAVVATGILALWMSLTDAMLKYLKPSMRPWLLIAGCVLVSLGAVQLRRKPVPNDETEPHDAPGGRTGWLLLCPIVVVILFGANSLGAFTISGPPGDLPSYAFDIGQYALSKNQTVPTIGIADVLVGIRQSVNRAYLLEHDVKLVGFANHIGSAGPGTFILTRFLISCCAADSIALSVTISGARELPKDGRWLRVTARLQPTRTRSSPDEVVFGPPMEAQRVDAIREPSEPYESLRNS